MSVLIVIIFVTVAVTAARIVLMQTHTRVQNNCVPPYFAETLCMKQNIISEESEQKQQKNQRTETKQMEEQ